MAAPSGALARLPSEMWVSPSRPAHDNSDDPDDPTRGARCGPKLKVESVLRGWRSGRVPNDLCHGVDPIHERHVEIQNGHLRTEVPRQPDRLDAVRGLPDDGKPLTLEEPLQALADDDVVVGEDDSQRSSLGRRSAG